MMPHYLRARISDVRKDAGWAAKYVVFENNSGVQRNVVLNLDILPHNNVTRDRNILPQHTSFADLCPSQNVARVPDFGSGSDLTGLIDVGRAMNEEISFRRLEAGRTIIGS